PGVVGNGDSLRPCDPWALERARWESGSIGAVALFPSADASSRGRVESGPSGTVTRFVEKDPAFQGPAWVNGGLYAFSPALWRRVPGPRGGAGPRARPGGVPPAAPGGGGPRRRPLPR